MRWHLTKVTTGRYSSTLTSSTSSTSLAGLKLLSSLLDHTDIQFNIGDDEPPKGRQSTNELMARDGMWKTADNALANFNGLLTIIKAEVLRFGAIKNDYDTFVTDLCESTEYAKTVREAGAKFNLSVLM